MLYFLGILKTLERLIWKRAVFKYSEHKGILCLVSLVQLLPVQLSSYLLLFFWVDLCLWITKYSPRIPLFNITYQSFHFKSENHPSTFKGSYLEKSLYWGAWSDFFHFYLWSWFFSISLSCARHLFFFNYYYSFHFEILFNKWSFILVYVYWHFGFYFLPVFTISRYWNLQLLT